MHLWLLSTTLEDHLTSKLQKKVAEACYKFFFSLSFSLGIPCLSSYPANSSKGHLSMVINSMNKAKISEQHLDIFHSSIFFNLNVGSSSNNMDIPDRTLSSIFFESDGEPDL
jgi:hypothetical protein